MLETGWGPIPAHVTSAGVTLDLPDIAAPADPIAISGRGASGQGIPDAVGVPHLVVFVEDGLADLPIARVAPPLRRHPLLPEGANVNFVAVESPHALAVRTFERGVEGETLACGSGVVASAIVAARLGRVDPPVACRTKSGVAFTVRFEETGQLFTNVALSGDAHEIYSGELTEEAFAVKLPIAPSKIIGVGRNYREHAKELGNVAPEKEPLLFLKAPSALIFDGDAIVLPPESRARRLRGRARARHRPEDQELAAGALARGAPGCLRAPTT